MTTLRGRRIRSAVIRTQTPLGGVELLLALDVAVPLLHVRPVLVSLVLQHDPVAAVDEVGPADGQPLASDDGVALRFGQPGQHQAQPQLGLARRVDVSAHQPRGPTRQHAAASSVLVRRLDQGLRSQPALPHQVVPGCDELDEVQGSSGVHEGYFAGHQSRVGWGQHGDTHHP